MTWSEFAVAWLAIGLMMALKFQPEMGGPATILMILFWPIGIVFLLCMFVVVFIKNEFGQRQ